MPLTGNTNAEKIWNYLISHGLSKEGAAGLMGNIYAESGLIPTNLQNTFERKLGYTDATYTAAVDSGKYTNFSHDDAGYGLCQWTYWSRKKALLEFAKSAGKSIGDLEMQLDFMLKEMATYAGLVNKLRTTRSLQEASDVVLTTYERPTDQSGAMKAKRASYGESYLRQFGGKTSEAAEVGAAIDKLAALGVINSPGYWKEHYADVRYVGSLLNKAAATITKAGTRSATVEEGVAALAAAGIINTPDYWKKQTGTVGELLKALGGAAAKRGISEAQLRQRVCDAINSWLGAARGSATHLEILRIYNSHKPLARGYTVQVNDAHCATTTSAAFIKAGIADYTGTECGVEEFVKIAKQKGIWTETDAYVPKLGDAIVYDWQDGADYAKTDNTGWSDHIGIVTKTGMGAFTVTEGNMNGGKVGQRTMQVNGRYIRGFITPDYAAIARKLSA